MIKLGELKQPEEGLVEQGKFFFSFQSSGLDTPLPLMESMKSNNDLKHILSVVSPR